MAVDGKVVYEVDYDTTKAKKSIKNLNIDLKATGEKMSSIGSSMTSNVTLPILAGAGAGVAAFMELSTTLDEVKKSAIGVGAGVEGLQALQFAGRKAGVENDKMTDSLKKTQEIIGNNEKAFWDLGIATRDFNGDARDTDIVFKNLLNAFAEMDDVTRRETALGLGFTEELTTINKLLDENSGFMDNYATGLENAVSAEDMAKFEAFNDSLEDIKGALVPIATDLALTVLPYFQEFSDWFAGEGLDAVETGLPKLIDFVTEYGVIIAGIAAAGPVLSTTGKAISGIAKILPFLNPTTATVGVIGGLTVAGWQELAEAWDAGDRAGQKLRTAIDRLLDSEYEGGSVWVEFAEDMSDAFSELEGILGDVKEMLTSLIDVPLEGYNAIVDGIESITGAKLPKAIKLEEIFGVGSANPSQVTVGGFRQAADTANSLNVGQVTINTTTDMSPGNVERFTDDVMEQMSQQLQLRNTFK